MSFAGVASFGLEHTVDVEQGLSVRHLLVGRQRAQRVGADRHIDFQMAVQQKRLVTFQCTGKPGMAAARVGPRADSLAILVDVDVDVDVVDVAVAVALCEVRKF